MDKLMLLGVTLWLMAVAGAFIAGYSSALLRRHVAELEHMKRTAPWLALSILLWNGPVHGQTMYSAPVAAS